MIKTTEFAERLNDLKLENHLNNAHFAKICGCKEQSVSAWLNGAIYPKLHSLLRISNAFSLSLDFLLGLTETKQMSRSQNPVPFSERLQNLIRLRGLSQYEVAKRCGFDRSIFAKWNSGFILPQTETAIKLAECLNCSMEYLFGLSDIR